MKKKAIALLIMGTMLMGAMAVTGCGKELPPEAIGDVDTATIDVQSEVKDTGASEAVSQEAESQKTEPELKTITITATGDCTLGKTQSQPYEPSFWAYYDKNGADYFFSGVRDVFEQDDFTLINLECVLTESDDRVEKTFNLKGKPEYTAIMTGSSVEGCTLGNNHSRDYGEESLTDTENYLTQAGLSYAINDHIGTYTTDDGLVIGYVSACLLSYSDTYVNYLKDGIASLKSQGVDLIIACCHWGIEREYYPGDYQRDVAHQLVDCGADLVIGNHPHVLQGVEVYNGKVICYSLGNFCFGGNMNPSDKRTMMFQQTFSYEDGVLLPGINARIIPCRLSSTTDCNDYQPTILEGDNMQKIINDMNEYSKPYSSISFDNEGKLVVDE